MNVRETFAGILVGGSCFVQQHRVQLLFSAGLLVSDLVFGVNSYNEFNPIILLLSVGHLVCLILVGLTSYFEESDYPTFRRLSCVAASLMYLCIIIFTLSWYNEALTKINEKSPELPKVGAFHMLNIYQYWILLEIEACAAYFVGAITYLAPASCRDL
jgi:hypothetical protein